MSVRIFAAIDVGSFELELGIYEISGKNGIRVIDHVRHVIALGSDTFHNGKISYHLVDELCQVLEEFVVIMKSYQADAYAAYATSAMREARNSRIVLEQIKVRTGLTVRVISNSEQRFLTYKAVAAREDEFEKGIEKGTAIVDVGFGSMQMSLFDKGLLISTENLPLGTLKIRGALTDINTTVDRTRILIDEMVDSILLNYKKMYLKDRNIHQLIAIGEGILYLFRYADGGKPQRRVTREQFYEFYERLSQMNEVQIEEKFGVSRRYATLLLPSAVIYKKVLELTGAEMIWIPGIRLTDGMAAEYADNKKIVRFRHNFDNDIISTSRNMAKRYRCHSAHTELVEKFALEIFDTMKKYHGMGKRERLLLQIAVIIHGCGKFISIRNSNECAYNIIMSTEIIGISHDERQIIANVVRSNVRDFDYELEHLDSKAVIDGGSKMVIAKLTAILWLANSMDRGHQMKLKDRRMSVKNGCLLVVTEYDGDLTLESIAFEERAPFFEEIFGIRPVLKQKRSR